MRKFRAEIVNSPGEVDGTLVVNVIYVCPIWCQSFQIQIHLANQTLTTSFPLVLKRSFLLNMAILHIYRIICALCIFKYL